MAATAPRILLVDDELSVQKLLTYPLRKEGYDVIPAMDGREALERLGEDDFDLVVLDVMLPHVDGFAVCRQIRARSTVPIIMLTAKAEEIDKVLGLELGADDYITKPFSVREFRSRVKAVLRRAALAPTEERFEEPIKQDGLSIDFEKRQVDVREQPVKLTYVEFEILAALARAPGRVFTRTMLLERVWGDAAYRDPRTIDVHIRHLREKLELEPKLPELILTVRHVLVVALLAQREAHLDGAHVGGVLEHLGEGEPAILLPVVDGGAGDGDGAVLAVEAIAGTHHALLEGGGGKDHLERRARLERIGHRAVAPLVVAGHAEGVGIEGRPDGDGEHVARARIQRHRHGGAGAGAAPRGVDLFLGDVLESGVQREHHALPGMGRLEHHRGAGDLAAQRVALHEGATLLPRQVSVPRLLDAAQPLALRALEAHHVGGELAIRVEPQALFQEAERGLLERAHRLRRRGRQAALHEHDALGGVEAPGKLARWARRGAAPGGGPAAPRRRSDGAGRRESPRRTTPPAPDRGGRGWDRAWGGGRPPWRAGSPRDGGTRRA